MSDFMCRSHACHDGKPDFWPLSSIQKAATLCHVPTTTRSCLPSLLSSPPAPGHQAGIARRQGYGPAKRKRGTRVKDADGSSTLVSLLRTTRFPMSKCLKTLERLRFARVLIATIKEESYATIRCYRDFCTRTTNINVLRWSCAKAHEWMSTVSPKAVPSFTQRTYVQRLVCLSEKRNCLAFSSSRSSNFCFS